MNLALATVDGLVDADPRAVEDLARAWAGLGILAAEVSGRCASLDAAGWTGEAADAFRARLARVPLVLRETAEGLGSAVGVLSDWSEVVGEARTEIACGIELHEQGEHRHRWWLENHAVLEATTGLPVPDPGLATMEEAQRIVRRALDRFEDRARWTAARLDGIADQALGRFSMFSDVAHGVDVFAGGVVEAIGGLVGLARVVSPIRLVVDSDGVVADVTELTGGLSEVIERFGDDPGAVLAETTLGLIGFDTLISNPARWAGEMAPDLAGAASGMGLGRHLDDLEELVPLPHVDPEVMERLAQLGLVRMEGLVPRGHFVLRHGPHTTLDEQFVRATTGLSPDGTRGRKTDASRFGTWTDMFDAVELGTEHHRRTGDEYVYVMMDREMGAGFLAGSTDLRTTRWVELRFDGDHLYTAFPRLQRPPRVHND